MAYPQGSVGAAPQKPSKTGIVWAVVIFVVTAIIGIAMIVGAVVVAGRALDDFQRVDAGDTRKVTLSSGDQYVFVVADTSRELDQVTVSITDASGAPVRLRSGTDINANGDSGVADTLGYIAVDSGPASYTVTVDGPPGANARIGKLPIGQFFGLLFGGIAIGGLGFVVALVILVVALVRRSRVKKANRLAATGGDGQPGAPPGGPAPTTPPPPAPPAAAPTTPPPPAPQAAPPPAPPAPEASTPTSWPPPPGPAEPS